MEGIGRYHLDTIDDIDFSTNSYELYILYLKLFDYRKYQRIMYKDSFVRPRSSQEPCFPADHKNFLKALEQEQRVYDCGFRPVVLTVKDKHGHEWRRTRWMVKND